MHGSEGGFAGWMARDALALAMNGFVTFAYAYSKGGNHWHAGDIHDVDLDQTVDALRWLREHSTVSGKVGFYGGSRGAEHAILWASLMARDGLADPPDAVAAHAASEWRGLQAPPASQPWKAAFKKPPGPRGHAIRWRHRRCLTHAIT